MLQANLAELSQMLFTANEVEGCKYRWDLFDNSIIGFSEQTRQAMVIKLYLRWSCSGL